MDSTPITPARRSESREMASSLPSSVPSSPPLPPAPIADDSFDNVYGGMKMEEKQMREIGKAKEKRKREQAQRKQENFDDESMNKRIEFLLSQSKVFSSIMEKKREEQSLKKDQLKASNNNGNHAQSTTAGKDRQMATRSKRNTDSNTEGKSMAAVIAEAAEEDGVKSTGIGSQNLRSEDQPKLVTGGTMRPYQLEGLHWLTSLYGNGLNGILADEMGLGKTIQTISLLAFLREKGTKGPFLVVAPLSTLSNWIDEFARWTPDIPALLYHGAGPTARAQLRRSKMKDPSSVEFPVVCTSYEICMNDRIFLSKYKWKYIIVDEGHRLKNLNCRLIRELKMYDSANRLLITGTPLQNNLTELWSLLNFLLPEVFDKLENFESYFDFSEVMEKGGHMQERKASLVASLHAILKPFLLRRVKTDVESSLPKKREYIIYAPLTTTQKELYRQIVQGNSRAYLEEKAVERLVTKASESVEKSRSSSLKRKAISSTVTPNKSAKSSRDSTPARSIRSGRKGIKRKNYKEANENDVFQHSSESESEPDEEEAQEMERAKTMALAKKEISQKKLQNPIMQLRLCCNSPHNFYWPWNPSSSPDNTLTTASGKMLLLSRLIPHLLANSHKILLFSQFTSQLDILEEWTALTLPTHKTCRIDGSVSQPDRRAQINAFNTDPSCSIFLLSTRAGGQGINLTAADSVILFDSDWNPQQDLQAQDRAHRIGQTRPVIVYRLATKGTIEQTLLEKADGKRRLEKLVIQKGKFRSLASSGKDDGEELRLLLERDDFEKYEIRGEGGEEELLSLADLEILDDRTEAAYARAEKGEGAGGEEGKFRTVASKTAGEGLGLLGEMGT